ncbi:MAG: hypothetical protein Q7K65_02440 [Candidatus Buchananbacteria bacterium]|nr:hypothetical protein [Candidatus Buchananbacteria bacterium]
MEEQDPQQFNVIGKGSINIWLAVIISVVVTAVLVGGGVYFWQKTIIDSNSESYKSLQNQITDLQTQLKSTQEELLSKIDENNNQLPESGDSTDNWLEYKHYGYSFLYPNHWTTAVNGGYILFFDGKDVKMELKCPILEIGYEAWNFQTSQRQIISENKSKTVKLWLGTPLNDLNPIALIFIGSGENDEFQKSCQLSGGGYDDLFVIFEKIYNSIK